MKFIQFGGQDLLPGFLLMLMSATHLMKYIKIFKKADMKMSHMPIICIMIRHKKKEGSSKLKEQKYGKADSLDIKPVLVL